MPPLITREEAQLLGEIEDHAQIEALVQRAWQARVERFADSTDMCSLVNAKSGGCAEDCGFCAQSRFADAETPMHAMMEPEQVLEHARAAEAAGAHRFCMVTQGQGLSKRDFQKYLEGVRLVSEHTNLKRCASVGHISAERAKALREAGIQRVHHNVETAHSYYDEVTSTVRYEGRLRTIEAVREAGLETCVGGILNLGETPRAARGDGVRAGARSTRRACPSTCSTRGPGTKFGDREYMDPWEAVKWIAIFRLILPDALFRLCGGRVENLGDLQQLAVQAGINGVMMGNFLTTLGNAPEEDREMFERARAERRAPARQRGQPSTRQSLRLAVRRDARRGRRAARARRSPAWRRRRAADEPRQDGDLVVRLWDPSTQLRYRAKRSVPPRPDGARNRAPSAARRGRSRARAWVRAESDLWRPADGSAAEPGASTGGCMHEELETIEIEERLAELERAGLSRRLRLVSGPQGPDGAARRPARCCCCARTTTSAWPTIPACARPPPRRRCAGASALDRRA